MKINNKRTIMRKYTNKIQKIINNKFKIKTPNFKI